MPLSNNEQRELAARISEMVAADFSGEIGSSSIAMLCDKLVVITELLSVALEKALNEDERSMRPEKPATEKPVSDQPKRRGRPAKVKAEPLNGPEPKPEPEPEPESESDSEPDLFPTEEPEDDPLGIPHEPPQEPAPPSMTEAQVKDVLKAYMQAFGSEGTGRLTDLLVRLAGVKRFSDVPKDKWFQVVKTAQAELGGKRP